MGWLSKNFDIQGEVIFQARDYTCKYVECLKNHYDAGDRNFLRRHHVWHPVHNSLFIHGIWDYLPFLILFILFITVEFRGKRDLQL